MALPSLARVPAPPDPILGLAEAFRADPRPGKINLSSGVFVDESGTTPVLPSVTEAERRILAKGATKLYRPIDGDAGYRDAVRAFVFGTGHELATSPKVAVSQTPGGTGGLRVAADFLRQAGASATIWMSEPTWPNHPQLFQLAGFRIRTYPYTDPSGRRIDEVALLAALGEASPGDTVLLHGSCHNPTGVDPSPGLWRAIGDLLEERRLLPLVDFAYQGFGDGIREDADWMDGSSAGRGAAHLDVVLEEPGPLQRARREPRRGGPLRAGCGRRAEQRQGRHPGQLLEPAEPRRRHRDDDPGRPGPSRPVGGRAGRDASPDQGQPGPPRRRPHLARDPRDWAPIATQRGMFALLGLSVEQVARLREEHAVYVVGKGRINVAGFSRHLRTVRRRAGSRARP